MRSILPPAALLIACGPRPEPLDLPDDPSAPGVPVGVHTRVSDDVTLEVWYPATDRAAGAPTVDIDLAAEIPASFIDHLGEIDIPVIPTAAIRDAELRVPESPYPVVVFSHGFGGNRLQSPDFTVHLASRGYVVIAADHPGRALSDLLPCLFTPPLEGCNLATDDPAPDQIDAAVAWLRRANRDPDDPFHDTLDLSRMGLSGHSAGGMSTTTVGQDDERFIALLPMAAGGVVTRDVPLLSMAGTCDAIVEFEQTEADWTTGGVGHLLALRGAGHLAFTDLCLLDLGAFAETHLMPRHDLNQLFADTLVQLATDGCPAAEPTVDHPDCTGAFLDLQTSAPIVRHYATTFFDAHLRDQGEGPTDGLFADAELY